LRRRRERYYGDEPLAALRQIAEVVLNRSDEHPAGSALAAAAQGCDVIISYRQSPGEVATFAGAPDLVAFLRCAVDIRNVDVAAASAHGVLVCRATPGFVDAVAELAFGFIVDLARGISDAALAYRGGQVPAARMGRQLSGSTLGIVGFGRIGQRCAELGLAFGMRVLVDDPHVRPDDLRIGHVRLAELLAAADVVLCLAAATPETERLFDAGAFAAMRHGALFVNLARGDLVDEAALRAALDAGRLGGAALDVGAAPDQMPTPSLAAHPLVLATPHVGGLTPAAVMHQAFDTVRQVAALARGEVPAGAVNAAAAYRLARLGVAA
jgi:D-3-phosphoglycerate dehydrogenase